jgi:hypothetical protein
VPGGQLCQDASVWDHAIQGLGFVTCPTLRGWTPPVPRVLPDAGDYLAIYDEIERVLQTQGWQAAFTLFQVRIGHMPPDRPGLMTALLDPAQVFPPW